MQDPEEKPREETTAQQEQPRDEPQPKKEEDDIDPDALFAGCGGLF